MLTVEEIKKFIDEDKCSNKKRFAFAEGLTIVEVQAKYANHKNIGGKLC